VSATRAMTVLSLRCLFFTKPSSPNPRRFRRVQPNQRSRRLDQLPCHKRASLSSAISLGSREARDQVLSRSCAALGTGFPKMENPGAGSIPPTQLVDCSYSAYTVYRVQVSESHQRSWWIVHTRLTMQQASLSFSIA
jgi:hypothetical protein